VDVETLRSTELATSSLVGGCWALTAISASEILEWFTDPLGSLILVKLVNRDSKESCMQAGLQDRRKRLGIVLASAAVLAVGGSVPLAYAGGGHGDHGGRNELRASLTGAKEVPGPGDPDGRGTARVSLKGNRICFDLSWRNIDAPTAAHIHVGSRRDAGPVVVGLLSVPAPGLGAPVTSVGGCADADRTLVTAIRRDPRNYYVNIHNVAYPAGAIRGQLH
jgi:hypothetical protein